MIPHEQGRQDALTACYTGRDTWRPPTGSGSDYARGWLAGCSQYEREQAERSERLGLGDIPDDGLGEERLLEAAHYPEELP